MNWIELNKAIEKKAIEHLEANEIDVNVGTIHASENGIYRVITYYLTQEQIDEIVKIHKLEL